MKKHSFHFPLVLAFLLGSAAVFGQCPVAGLWRITEEDDDMVADHSSAGNNCSVEGGFAFADDPDRGIVGSFDGNSWLSTDSSVTELGNSDFSYAAWVKTTQAGGVIVGKADMSDAWARNEKKFYLAPTSGDGGSDTPGVVCMVGWGCDWITGGSASPAVNDGEWHHIVFAFERDLVGNNPGTIYVDGELVTDYMRQGFNGNPDNPGDLVYIGRSPGGDGVQNYSGLLDDVAIFNFALTQEEVELVMDGEFDQFIGESAYTAPTIEGAPESDSIAEGIGLMYTAQLQPGGCPYPDLAVLSPEEATISADGLLSYDTSLAPAGESSFTVTVEAANAFEGGTALQVSWDVTLVEPGLIDHWPFDEDLSDIAGDAAGTAVGGVEVVSDAITGDGAVRVYGGGDYVDVLDQASLDFNMSESYSLAAWVKPASEATVGWTGVVTKGRDSGPWWGIWISPDSEWTYGASSGSELYGTEVEPNVWTHVTIVQDGGIGIRELYVDAVSVAAGDAGNSSNNGDLVIGGALGIDEWFTGVIDDVRVYNKALTSGEIESLMEVETEIAPEIKGAPEEDMVYYGRTYTCNLEIAGFPKPEVIIELPEGMGTGFTGGVFTFDTTFLPPDTESFTVAIEADNGVGERASVSWEVTVKELPELIALWQFEDEPGSVVATDSTDAGFDAELVGDALLDDDSEADPARSGVINFAGDGYLETGESVTELGDSDFSYAAWVKTTQAGGVIVSKADMSNGWASNEKKFYLAPTSGDGGSDTPGVVCMVGWGCDWITGGSWSPAVNGGEWHHIVLTFQRDLVGNNPGTIYVDGELVTDYMRQGFNGNPDNPGDLVYIGRSPGGDGVQNYSGLLDDVALFTIALNQEQVLDIMDGNYEDFISVPPKDLFRRGDVNADGKTDISDAICMLSYLFGPEGNECQGTVAQCMDAADSNDDGKLDISDAIYLLNYQFAGGPVLPEPFMECGTDPTPDNDPLNCQSFPPCEER